MQLLIYAVLPNFPVLLPLCPNSIRVSAATSVRQHCTWACWLTMWGM